MHEQINPFYSIYEKLDIMDQEKKVDLSILKDFQKLQEEFSVIEAKCIENKKLALEDAFLIYHASRSSRMILEKIGKRFKEAKEKHENPQVVDLSKMVLPCMNDLYNLIISSFKYKLSENMRTLILQRLKTLRDAAAASSMLPTIVEEKKGISKIKLRDSFKRLADNLQAMLNEE
jgi:hypothetical protein